MARRPIGRAGLKSALLLRGLSEALADEVIADALQDVDEETLARQALRLRRHGRRFRSRVMAAFLRQRGFAEETIERIISDRTIEGQES